MHHETKDCGQFQALRISSRWLLYVFMLWPAVSLGAQTTDIRLANPVYLTNAFSGDSDESGVLFKAISLSPDGCFFTYVFISANPTEHQRYSCHLISATGLNRSAQKTSFAIRFDLPTGSLTQNFTNSSGDIRLDTSIPGAGAPFKVGDRLFFQTPLERQELEVIPIGADRDSQVTTRGAQLHFQIDGVDCVFLPAAAAPSPCIASFTGADSIYLTIKGGAGPRPFDVVNATRHTDGHWYYQPRRPESENGDTRPRFTVVAPKPLWDVQATISPATVTRRFDSSMRNPETGQTVYLRVTFNDRDCSLRERQSDWAVGMQIVTYPCEVISKKPAASRISIPYADFDYGVVIDMPEGRRYLALNADPFNPAPATPIDVPAFEASNKFQQRRLPRESLELDLPSDPPAHLSVRDSDCVLSAPGYGSFSCDADGDDIEIDGLHLDHSIPPSPHMERINDNYLAIAGRTLPLVEQLVISRLLVGWVVPGNPKQALRFGPPRVDFSNPCSPGGAPNDERPPLIIALTYHEPACVKDMIAKGADMNPGAKYGTPLIAAIEYDDQDSALLLVNSGVNVNETDSQGDSPLLEAVEHSVSNQDHFRDLIQSLIHHGANMDLANSEKMTPALYAVFYGREPEILKLLLDNGAHYSLSDLAELKAKRAAGEVMARLYFGLPNGGPVDPGPVKAPPEPMVKDWQRLSFHASPAPGLVSYVGRWGAALAGESVTVTDLTNGRHARADTRRDGSLWVDIQGDIDDLYSVEFDVPGKRGEPRLQSGGDTDLDLILEAPRVDSPKETSVTGGDNVTFVGRYAGPADLGIVVGGQIATLSHGLFIANGVGLKPGLNTITIALTTLNGQKLTKTVMLDSRGEWPIDLDVNADDLANPLTISFGYRMKASTSLRSLTLSSDWGMPTALTVNDPAVLSAAATGAPSAITHSYPAPGVYPVYLDATDSHGISYATRTPILVPDPAELDTRTTAAWHYFLSAVPSGDRKLIMSVLTADGRRRLGGKVDGFIRHPHTLPDSRLPLVRETSAGGILTYVVGRTDSKLHVEFKQDADGVWRIDSIN